MTKMNLTFLPNEQIRLTSENGDIFYGHFVDQDDPFFDKVFHAHNICAWNYDYVAFYIDNKNGRYLFIKGNPITQHTYLSIQKANDEKIPLLLHTEETGKLHIDWYSRFFPSSRGGTT